MGRDASEAVETTGNRNTRSALETKSFSVLEVQDILEGRTRTMRHSTARKTESTLEASKLVAREIPAGSTTTRPSAICRELPACSQDGGANVSRRQSEREERMRQGQKRKGRVATWNQGRDRRRSPSAEATCDPEEPPPRASWQLWVRLNERRRGDERDREVTG
ncbi:hypothetical protein VTN96DRAFT_9226 [Rasamsonia emersonii]